MKKWGYTQWKSILIGEGKQLRTIFDLCMEGERQRGTHPRTWWWDQEINVDLESEEDSSSGVSEDH